MRDEVGCPTLTRHRLWCNVVQRLLQTPDVDYRDRIAIISRYHAQVDLIRQQLAQTPPLLGNEHLQNHLRLKVTTIDSMQGSERDVTIFSAVRSNNFSNAGFVRDKKRMNFSISRARNLNIIIADSGMTHLLPGLQEIFTACKTGRRGCIIVRAIPNSQADRLDYVTASNTRANSSSQSLLPQLLVLNTSAVWFFNSFHGIKLLLPSIFFLWFSFYPISIKIYIFIKSFL